MRAASATRLVQALTLIAGVWAGLAAAAPVPVPAALTGATLDGQLVGATPFLDPPAYDPVDGALLFRAALSRGTVPEAIFRLPASGQPPAVLATAGQPATSDAVFSRFLGPRGCAGAAAFWAGLAAAGAGSPPVPDSGVFVHSDGALAPAALVGEPAPGGGLITALGSAPGIDSDGRSVFLAATDASPGLVLLRRSPGGALDQILAPGTPVDTGATVSDVLDAQAGCGVPNLARASLDREGSTIHALLRETASGWQEVLAEDDPLPGGGSVGLPLLPAVARPDGSLTLVVARPGGAGPALMHVAPGGALLVLAAVGDALGDITLTGLGAPTAWDADRVALLASAQGADGTSQEIVLAASPDGSLAGVLDPLSTAPDGSVLGDIDTPAGDGAGHLALRAVSLTDPTAGLLRVTAQPDRWLARAGQQIGAWGRLLAGGLRSAGPSLSGAGRAAFVATLPPGRDGEALFLATAGQAPLSLLAPGDLLSSGLPVASLEGPPASDDAGAVWLAARAGEDGRTLGYVRVLEGQAGSMPVAEGDPSPLGGTIRTLGRVVAPRPSDGLVFTATLSQATAGSAVLGYDPAGGLQALAAVGQAAPGGGVWSAFGFAPAALDATGAAFLAYTGGDRTGSGIYHAVAPGGGATAVALSGEPAPGGGFYAGFQDPVSGGSVLAFLAELEDGGVGVFRWDGAACVRLLATGDPLPGGGSAEAVGGLAVDGDGVVHAILEVSGTPWTSALYDLQAASGPLVTSGALLPLEDGSAAALAGLTDLAAAGSGLLAVGLDLGGWSDGAAVAHLAADSDGDGWGDPIDCAAGDAGSWRKPPVAGLAVATATSPAASRLAWSDLAGRAGSDTVHEVFQGLVSAMRSDASLAGAACAASGVTGGSLEIADGVPAPGNAFWYLVRGRNGCGAGESGEGDPDRGPYLEVCDAP